MIQCITRAVPRRACFWASPDWKSQLPHNFPCPGTSRTSSPCKHAILATLSDEEAPEGSITGTYLCICSAHGSGWDSEQIKSGGRERTGGK